MLNKLTSNTLIIMLAFSQKCKKEYNVSVYGDSKYVYHVLRYYTDTSLVDDWLELYR